MVVKLDGDLQRLLAATAGGQFVASNRTTQGTSDGSQRTTLAMAYLVAQQATDYWIKVGLVAA